MVPVISFTIPQTIKSLKMIKCFIPNKKWLIYCDSKDHLRLEWMILSEDFHWKIKIEDDFEKSLSRSSSLFLITLEVKTKLQHYYENVVWTYDNKFQRFIHVSIFFSHSGVGSYKKSHQQRLSQFNWRLFVQGSEDFARILDIRRLSREDQETRLVRYSSSIQKWKLKFH